MLYRSFGLVKSVRTHSLACWRKSKVSSRKQITMEFKDYHKHIHTHYNLDTKWPSISFYGSRCDGVVLLFNSLTMKKKQRSLAEIGKCPNCEKPFVKDWESSRNVINQTGVITKKWDGHNYRADCECMNPNLRFCIG